MNFYEGMTDISHQGLKLAYEYGLSEFYNEEMGNFSFTNEELNKYFSEIQKLLRIPALNSMQRWVLVYEDGYCEEKCWFAIILDDLLGE